MWPRHHGKSNAKKVTMGGVTHASKLEGRFYTQYLLPRSKAGDFDIELQKKFILEVNGQKIAEYWADFVCTTPSGEMMVYETKGRFMGDAKIKIRLVEALYGIPVWIAYSLSKIERLKGYKKRK